MFLYFLLLYHIILLNLIFRIKNEIILILEHIQSSNFYFYFK